MCASHRPQDESTSSRPTRHETPNESCPSSERESVSQPPVIPGSGRLTRAAAASGSSAYQAVFEAVGSILLACGLGVWLDRRFETAPVGVLIGAVIGFGAFVLRLMRLGKELHPVDETQGSGGPDPMGREVADDLGLGEAPGISQVLRDEDEASETADASDGKSDAGRETRD